MKNGSDGSFLVSVNSKTIVPDPWVSVQRPMLLPSQALPFPTEPPDLFPPGPRKEHVGGISGRSG